MRAIVIVVAGVLLAVLPGCAAEQPPEPFGVPTAAAPVPPDVVLTPAEEELFGPRVELPNGLLLKQLGKVAQWGGPNDTDPNTWGVRLVVDSIAVDPACDEYVSTPDRGHRLILSVRVETSPSYDSMNDGIPQYFEWSTIAPDGVSEASPTSSSDCHSSVAFPHEMRPSAKYRGEVTVETANPRGQLVFADFAAWDYGFTTA